MQWECSKLIPDVFFIIINTRGFHLDIATYKLHVCFAYGDRLFKKIQGYVKPLVHLWITQHNTCFRFDYRVCYWICSKDMWGARWAPKSGACAHAGVPSSVNRGRRKGGRFYIALWWRALGKSQRTVKRSMGLHGSEVKYHMGACDLHTIFVVI